MSTQKTTITKMKVQRDLLMEFLDSCFDERAEIFRQMFDVVDEAIATGNNQQLALTLDAIVLLANSSPCAALDDPDREWTEEKV